jgi:hypothetical protein
MKQGKLFYLTKLATHIWGGYLVMSQGTAFLLCMPTAWLAYLPYSDKEKSETTETSESEAYYSPTE